MNGNNKQRWLVWGVGASEPKVEHTSCHEAYKESLRLAKAHPGREFRVLRLWTPVTYKAPTVGRYEEKSYGY